MCHARRRGAHAPPAHRAHVHTNHCIEMAHEMPRTAARMAELVRERLVQNQTACESCARSHLQITSRSHPALLPLVRLLEQLHENRDALCANGRKQLEGAGDLSRPPSTGVSGYTTSVRARRAHGISHARPRTSSSLAGGSLKPTRINDVLVPYHSAALESDAPPAPDSATSHYN